MVVFVLPVGCVDSFAFDFRFGLIRVCQKSFNCVCRSLAETEAGRFLALANEIRKEVVEGIAVLVETEKVLMALSRDGDFLGLSFLIESRDDSTLSCLIVRDNQNILVIFLLFWFFVQWWSDLEGCY